MAELNTHLAHARRPLNKGSLSVITATIILAYAAQIFAKPCYSVAQSEEIQFDHPSACRNTYKVLLDVSEVFAVFLERFLEQVGFRCAPFLHFIPAEHRPTLGHQRRDGPCHVIAVLMQSVHGVKLKIKHFEIRKRDK